MQVRNSFVLILGLLCSCRSSLFSPLDNLGRNDEETIEEQMKVDPQKAIDKAREVLKKDPNNNKVRLLLAEALIKKNDLSPIRRAIKKNIVDNGNSKDLLVADVNDYEKDLDSKEALSEAINSLQTLVSRVSGEDKKKAQFMYAETLIEQGFSVLKARCFPGGRFDRLTAQRRLKEEDAVAVLVNFTIAKGVPLELFFSCIDIIVPATSAELSLSSINFVKLTTFILSK